MLFCNKAFNPSTKNMPLQQKAQRFPSTRISFWKGFPKQFSRQQNGNRNVSANQFRRLAEGAGDRLHWWDHNHPPLLDLSHWDTCWWPESKPLHLLGGGQTATISTQFWIRKSRTKLDIPYLRQHISGFNPKLSKIICKIISLTSLPAAERNEQSLSVFLH